ncbi:CinA family protein [Taibaiella koreensis]|uniref:CinA family protein n=1 Tax=Taibaiella koreensis TaxID=1268548 RepID=UPI000E59C058|nr:CinA family protein [Taibaiella koreensis]
MKQLIRSIKEYCVYHYESIAVAENITSGCLQMLLGSVEQAGEYFQGGITTCNNHQLSEQLGVDPIASDRKNEVNLSLTIEMARKVALQFNSEIGLAINGCVSNAEGLYEPAYAAIVRLNKVIYAEKLVPMAKAPSAVPVEYAQRLIRILADKLMPGQEELAHSTAAILEPLS